MTSNSRYKARIRSHSLHCILGWIKVTYEINRNHGCRKTVDQVKARFQYLLKKWRDHKPTGAESTKTGNQKPDPLNCKDEEFSIIANYMARKGGHGTDLGQAQDVKTDGNSESDSKREAVSEEGTIPATPSFRTPVKPAKSDPFSELANSLEVGFVSIADGLKAIATSLSSHKSNEVMEHLLEAKKARLEDRDTLKDMRTFLETSNQVQLAMLQELKKLTEK